MLILGLESSCDESAVAVWDSDRREICYEQVLTQIDLHSSYGGVVPGIAIREHLNGFPVLLKGLSQQSSSPVFLLNRYLSSEIRETIAVCGASLIKNVAPAVAEGTASSRKALTRSGVVFVTFRPPAGKSLLFPVGVSPSVV